MRSFERFLIVILKIENTNITEKLKEVDSQVKIEYKSSYNIGSCV